MFAKQREKAKDEGKVPHRHRLPESAPLTPVRPTAAWTPCSKQCSVSNTVCVQAPHCGLPGPRAGQWDACSERGPGGVDGLHGQHRGGRSFHRCARHTAWHEPGIWPGSRARADHQVDRIHTHGYLCGNRMCLECRLSFPKYRLFCGCLRVGPWPGPAGDRPQGTAHGRLRVCATGDHLEQVRRAGSYLLTSHPLKILRQKGQRRGPGCAPQGSHHDPHLPGGSACTCLAGHGLGVASWFPPLRFSTNLYRRQVA